MRKNRIQIWMVASLCLVLLGGLGGCASSGGDGTQDEANSSATTTIPASSPLAKVQNGMNDSQVRSLLGEPAGTRNYPSPKAFIPFYFGGDGWRVAWLYPNVGRIVFSRNTYSGAMSVVGREHNPNQTK